MQAPDEFYEQLPDIDPAETREWIDSLDAVHARRGDARAEYLVQRVLARGQELGLDLAGPLHTP